MNDGFHLAALYVYGHLAISSSHIPVTELAGGEKGTLPNRNAEELPLAGHYHEDSQPQGRLMRAYVCVLTE